MSKEYVVVTYRTKRVHCKCCDQKLPEPVISDKRYFKFSIGNLLDSGYDWKGHHECNELKEVVTEFIHETINFFVTSYDDIILLTDEEINRVVGFILDTIVNREDEDE